MGFLEITLQLILAFLFFKLGETYRKSNMSTQIILIVEFLIKIDKRLSISGKSLKDLSTTEVLMEVNKQLNLELYN